MEDDPLFKHVKLLYSKYEEGNKSSMHFKDFVELCYDLGVYCPYSQMLDMFNELSSSGPITLHKFFQWYKEEPKFKKIQDLEERIQFQELIDSFRQYDFDSSGSLDQEEFTKMYDDLGFEYSNEEILAEFKKLDLDGNGEIEFQEWLTSKGY